MWKELSWQTRWKRTERDNRLLRSLFSDEAIAQAVALEKSLEPDPAADPVARIDQEWIRESREYIGVNSSGFIEVPDRRRTIGLAVLFGLLGSGAVILAIRLDQGFLFVFGGLFLLFALPLMLLALRQQNKYHAAAVAYRQRRAAALAALARADEADRPLPFVDTPVRLTKGLISLEEAITHLHNDYGFSQIGTQEYQRNRAGLLAEAPADRRSFYQELIALEHDWALQRRKLAIKRPNRADLREPPTLTRARSAAMAGIIGPLVITAFLAISGAPLLFALGGVLIGALILAEAWSIYQKAGRYERGQAEYLRRREALLARQRWDERAAG